MTDLIARIVKYVASINTWKQVLIVIILGASMLLATLLYQHPYWLENAWRYNRGLPLYEPKVTP